MAYSSASGGKTSDDGPYALNATDAREYFPHGGDMIKTGTLNTSAWYAWPNTNKTNLYERRRPNMCTAALDRSVVPVLRIRGYGTSTQKLRIVHILHILRFQLIQRIQKN